MAEKSRILGLFHQFFDIDPGTAVPQRPIEYGGFLDQFQHSSSYDSGNSETRVTRYANYDAMEFSSDLSVALDIYAEEASQTSVSEEKAVWVESDDEEVKNIIISLLENLNIEDQIFGMARHLSKYGDLFCVPTVDSKNGITELTFLHPSVMSVLTDPKTGKVIGYESESADISSVSSDLTSMDYIKDLPEDIRVRVAGGLAPWDVAHFRIAGSNLQHPYGHSMIEKARRPWQTLSMLETSVALWRLTRAGNRLLFSLDVGTASPGEAKNALNKFKNAVYGNTDLKLTSPDDIFGGSMVDFLFQYNLFSPFKDIFWPMAKDSASKVEVLTMSPDLAAMEDIEHFQNKVRTALGIPKAYFDQDISGWNANKALAMQDIRFAKKIHRIQRSLVNGLQTICALHLLYIGKTKFKFTIKMEEPSALFELQRIEIMKEKVDNAIAMMEMADAFGLDPDLFALYILSEYVGMSDHDIKTLKKKEKLADDEEKEMELKRDHLDALNNASPDSQRPGPMQMTESRLGLNLNMPNMMRMELIKKFKR